MPFEDVFAIKEVGLKFGVFVQHWSYFSPGSLG